MEPIKGLNHIGLVQHKLAQNDSTNPNKPLIYDIKYCSKSIGRAPIGLSSFLAPSIAFFSFISFSLFSLA